MTFEIGSEYPTPPTMMHTDPPDHTRYRALVQPGFRPTFMRALESGIRDRTGALVDRIEPGVPDRRRRRAGGTPAAPGHQRSAGCARGGVAAVLPVVRGGASPVPPTGPRRSGPALSAEMVEYLLAAAADRRADPAGRHHLGARARPRSTGDRLTDAELAMFLVQLLVAGNETTRNMMSGGLVGFADAPGAVGGAARTSRVRPPRGRCRSPSRRCCGGPHRWCRSCGPPPGRSELGGRSLGEGEPVLMLYASANRDESVFGADRRPVRRRARDPNPHVAFGFGPHFCIGAVLARLEGRVLLEELLARFGSVELAGPVVRTASPVIAGVRSAPMVFGAA